MRPDNLEVLTSPCPRAQKCRKDAGTTGHRHQRMTRTTPDSQPAFSRDLARAVLSRLALQRYADLD